MIPSLKKGVVAAASRYLGNTVTVRSRPGQDGSPGHSYKGGEWFYGVYFAGASGGFPVSQEDFTVSLGVGLDITRGVFKVPTGGQGDFTDQNDELLDKAGQLAEVLMNPDWAIAEFCNAQLAETRNPNGRFYEHFDQVTISPVRYESCTWIGANEGDEKCPTLLVVSIAVAGIKFTRTAEAMAKIRAT